MLLLSFSHPPRLRPGLIQVCQNHLLSPGVKVQNLYISPNVIDSILDARSGAERSEAAIKGKVARAILLLLGYLMGRFYLRPKIRKVARIKMEF